MKRLVTVIAMLICTAALAQEKEKREEYNSVREFRNKVFSIQNRDPRIIASSVKLLGSGFKGADLSVNPELRTITVRDFPENIVAIEEAIKRLDQPAARTPDAELKISVLIGSKTAIPGASVPDDLASVVKQLESTLRYSHYGLMTSAVHRTKSGSGIEGSGVVDATLLGMTAAQDRPIVYSYHLRGVSFDSSSERASISTDNFAFSMRVPINMGANQVQYQSVGFETPVAMREGEKVVIGTTTMRDKALIVVVTATVIR
jgi:hypothetical protein